MNLDLVYITVNTTAILFNSINIYTIKAQNKLSGIVANNISLLWIYDP